jgi:L-lactate dehydrogenase
MNILRTKVSIIGCGNVGMRYAYALMISGIAREIVIVDLDRKRLEGEVMDLSHGVPYSSPVDIVAGDYKDIAGSDMVVITAGRKQKTDQTRIDLVKDNVELFKKMIPEISKYAPSAIYLVVTNPIDVLSYAAYKISGKPSSEVIGSGTVLDSARFRFLLGKHCGVDPRNIHAYILGEHGDTEFAAWSKIMVGGSLLKRYCAVCTKEPKDKCNLELNDIFKEVKESAYKIIERKGETSYGIGLALVRITKAILKDENAILPVSVLVENYFGVDDVYLGLPAVVNKAGVKNVLKLDLSEEEQAGFKNSANTIKSVIKQIGL